MQNNLKKKILNYDIFFDKTGVLFIEQTKTLVLVKSLWDSIDILIVIYT